MLRTSLTSLTHTHRGLGGSGSLARRRQQRQSRRRGWWHPLQPALRDEYFDAISTDNQLAILSTYWRALTRILPDAFEDPSEYTVQKTIGANVLNGLLVNVVNVLRSKGWSLMDVESYIKVLEGPLADLQGDNGEGDVVQGADFWRSGAMGAAGSFTSNAGRRVLQAKLKAALPAVEVGVMPTSDHYSGSIASRLGQFADHHYKPTTRHISHYEFTLLCDAAERLSSALETGEATSPPGGDGGS